MHIVLCGFPRAGTTLLYNMLRTTVTNFETYPSELAALSFENKEPVPRITKKPLDFLHAELIHVTLPEVSFLVCVRDPRAILCSKHWHSEEYFKVSWDWSIGYVKPTGKIKKQMGLIEMDDHISKLHRPVFIYYENLVNNPEDEQERLGEIYGFKYNGHFRDFYKQDIPELLKIQLNGVRPVDKTRLCSWKKFPERIRDQFTECPYLHTLLYKYRYETNDQWFKYIGRTL